MTPDQISGALLGAIGALALAAIGYLTAVMTARTKNAPKEIELDNQQREAALERAKLETDMQRDRADGEKAMREAMLIILQEGALQRADIRTLNDKLTVALDQLSQAKMLIDDLQDTAASRDKAEKERDEEVRKQIAAFEQQVAGLNAQVETLNADNKRLLDLVDTQDKELNRRDATISDLNKQLRDVREQLSGMQARMLSLENPATAQSADTYSQPRPLPALIQPTGV